MGDIIQISSAPTATANLNTTAVTTELALTGGASAASGLTSAAASGMAAASTWALPAMLCAAVEHQTSQVDAAIAVRGNKVSATNDRALTDMVSADEQNRVDLTANPVVSL